VDRTFPSSNASRPAIVHPPGASGKKLALTKACKRFTYSSLNLLSEPDALLLAIPCVRLLARLALFIEVSLLTQIIYLKTNFEQLIPALLLLADPS
jgi:hypothetical protein